jgi:hypothetical protein
MEQLAFSFGNVKARGACHSPVTSNIKFLCDSLQPHLLCHICYVVTAIHAHCMCLSCVVADLHTPVQPAMTNVNKNRVLVCCVLLFPSYSFHCHLRMLPSAVQINCQQGGKILFFILPSWFAVQL